MAIVCLGALASSACTAARADAGDGRVQANDAASIDYGRCEDAYDLVASVEDGALHESVDGTVFTDSDPFVCWAEDEDQTVALRFNRTTEDPANNCAYFLSYWHKSSGESFPSPQFLSRSRVDRIQFGVTATPDSTDSDCRGLDQIILDPVVRLSSVPPAGLSL